MSLVSIMMPCRNAEPYLEETLQSLAAQGEHPWELLVVDDGCTDSSIDLVRRFCPRASILQGESRGIGAALNIALAKARGELLAWIDADDLWAPGKLEAQQRALGENPGWDGCFVAVEQFLHDPMPGQQAPGVSGRHRGALLIRREAFARVGPFREDIGIGEFVDWCARAQEAGLSLGQLQPRLYRRRIHTSNTMRDGTTNKTDYLRVLKAALDRRRAR